MLLGIWLLIATQVDAGSDSKAAPTAAPNAERELGRVHWLRDFELAKAKSEREEKPLFLLFQEVPGCQTCVSFGDEVLSHPLLVEAIEDEFIPVAILNNKGGADRRVLQQFKEPAWNNPVVRFVNATGEDLIPRRDRIWQSAEIADRMATALRAANRPVPTYLSALREELAPSTIERATFAMGCYWAGEACLGALPGLLSSRTGDLAGREVVELRFDSSQLSYRELLSRAQKLGCADSVFAHGDEQLSIARKVYGNQARLARGTTASASDRNQKFHLKRSRRLANLDLTPTQATRLNHKVWAQQDPAAHLSPRQLKALN